MRNLLIVLAVVICVSCANKGSHDKQRIKLRKKTEFSYKLGERDSTDASSVETVKYNEQGYPVEEISSRTKVLYKYEKDSLLVSETHYDILKNQIDYKKNIRYNSLGLKESLEIFASFTNTKEPELVAGMNYFYDSNYKVVKKVYFGAIDYSEKELFESVSSDPKGPDVFERIDRRRKDSTIAFYSRNPDGKVSLLKLFKNTVSGFDTTTAFVYSYNQNGKILMKRERLVGKWSSQFENDSLFTGTRYYYTNDKLSKREILIRNELVSVDTYFYSDNAKSIEEQYYSFGNRSTKWKYIYNKEGNIIEAVRYNGIGEPEYGCKYEYEFY